LPQRPGEAKAAGLAIRPATLYRGLARGITKVGMKRVFWILAAAALSAAALFALLVMLLPRETLRTRIGEQIAAWTGRDVSLSGEPEIDIFPRLSVTLNDVQVAGPEGMEDARVVSMDRLTGTIRILPLLIGRVEIGSFSMVRPVIRLVRDADDRRNWAFDSGAAALQLAFAGDVLLGEFLLEDGAVIYEDRTTGEAERLDSVNLSVDWTSVRRPFAIEGSGIWRGEEVSFSAAVETPFDFVNGGATPIEMQIESAPVDMTFAGIADDYPSSRLSGPLTLSTASLRRFAAWLGNPIGPGSTLGPASLSGAATFRDGVLAVESAELALDGNSASGALKVAAQQRPEIEGTLAFAELDLTPYFANLSRAFRTAESWRDIRLDTDWFRALTADVRLSADSVQLGGFRSGATAAALSLRDARLEVGLARAVVTGGVLAGDLAIVDSGEGPDAAFEAQFRATDAGVAELAPLLGLPARITGTASAMIDAASRGGSLGAVVDALAGSARLGIRDGAVPLFGIAELSAPHGAPRGPADPLVVTPVTSLDATMSFSGGSGTIERVGVAAPSFSAEAVGRVKFGDGGLSLEGTIRPAASGGAGDAPVRPFRIEGTVRQPVAVPLALAN